MKKTLLALLMTLAMIVSLTACGGSGGSGEEPSAPAAEPNTGVAGIVFTVPDSWTLDMTDVGDYVQYNTQESDYLFSASTFDAEDLASMENSGEFGSVQEFYEKEFAEVPDTKDKGYTYDVSAIKVCGNEAKYVKSVRDDKESFSLSTHWMMDDVIYTVSISYPTEFDENGEPVTQVSEIPAISGDLTKAYDGVIASIQAGDGNSLQPAGLPVDSIDGFSFTAPEEYPVTYAEDKNITLENRDKGITISLRKVDEEEFSTFEWEGEGLPTNLEEYFEMGKIDSESVEIAGYEGYKNKYPAEDGNFYDINAGFMADGVVYEIGMYADAYDENGLKADAVPLTDEDFAVFDSFIASITKK